MFGADTSLVMDALEMGAILAGVTAGAVYLLMRRRRTNPDASRETPADKTRLEQRVVVLERIATDRSIDLAEEIEALRDAKPASAAKERA